MTFTDGAIVAGLLTLSLGLVEVTKRLVERRNGKKNGRLEERSVQVSKDVVELKAGVLSVHQQVRDRDGVPLSFHLREHTEILRAMLTRMEGVAEVQKETTTIQKTILAKLDRSQ